MSYSREQIESWGPQSAENLRAALGETAAPSTCRASLRRSR